MRAPHRRRRLVAVAVVASTTLAGLTAIAGPTDATAPNPQTPRVTLTPRRADLPAARGADGQTVEPKAASLPASGRYAFLLKLDATSTGARFRSVNRTRSTAAAKAAARSQLDTVAAAQRRVIGQFPSLQGRTQVLYRTHAALAGVAVLSNVRNFHALGSLTGVSAVYPIAPKTPTNSYAVPFQGAPTAWQAPGGPYLGQGILVADIDTGIDFTHADFGGPGTTAAYDTAEAADTAPPAPGSYDPAKFDAADSYDLVGDAYNGGSSATPHADHNPLDCSAQFGGDGHGSHTAGTIAGYGVAADGTTYHGPYDSAHVNTDATQNFEIGPGMAPKAQIMSLRVFGCTGSTNLVSAAIDRAMDPNGDGDTSDHADVINLSLGSDYGSPDDGDAVMANQAADAGVTVAISMGNSSDVYDVGGSPGTAAKAITIAASVDAQSIVDGTASNAPKDNNKVAAFSSRGIRAAGDLKPDVAAVGSTVYSALPGSGTDGQSMSGTSMAAPMVAGEAALILAKHPGWTPEQVKADVMNTADQNLYVNGSADPSGSRYAPMRVGAGRIDAATALSNDVVAYVTDDPGAVSASWGPLEVSQPTTLTKTIQVQNLGTTPRTYTTGYDAITTVPGVDYSVSPSTVRLPAGGSATVTVTLSIPDPSALDRSDDPAKINTEPITGLDTSTVAEASGNVTLTPTAGNVPSLRVPVYSAPRPVSEMTQAPSLRLDASSNGALNLEGTDLAKPDLFSIAAGVELQAESPTAPPCGQAATTGCVGVPDDKGADIQYVGSTSDYPLRQDASNSYEYLAITTHGPHTTAADKVEFRVYLDTNEDGAPDLVAYNTRFGDSDLFVTDLVDLATGRVVDDLVTNGVPSNVDTAIFDSDTLLLPLWLGDTDKGQVYGLGHYGVDAAHPEFDYGVISFSSSELGYVDAVGVNPSTGVMQNPLTANAYAPGLSVTSGGIGPIFSDNTGASVSVTKNVTSYSEEGGQGLLMLHLHNAVGDKAQVVDLYPDTPIVRLISPATVQWGATAQLSVTALGAHGVKVPSGNVTVFANGVSVGTGTVTNGSATVAFRPLGSVGTLALRARYEGSAVYTFSESKPVPLTVTKATEPVGLSVAPTTVARGSTVRATVSVQAVAGGAKPSGTVTLLAGGKAVATGRLGSTGAVALPYVPRTAGRIALTASYSGDAHYAGATSAARSLTVNRTAPTVKLTVPRKVHTGAKATATVTVATLAGIAPTGRVTIRLNGRILKTVSLHRGTAVVTFTRREKGRITLVAAYAGDGNYLAATSRTVRVRII